MHQLALYVRETLLESNSLRARLARGMAWLLASSAASQAATLLASILAARLLGPTAFGELGVIRSTVLMLGTLAGAGLGMAAIKCVAEFRDAQPDRAGRVIGLLLNVALAISIVVAVVCFLLAEPLARELLQDSLAGPLRMSCVLIVLNSLNGVLIGAIVGLEAFHAVALLSLVEGFVTVVLIGFGAWAGGLAGTIMATIGVGVSMLVLRLAALCKQCRRLQIRIHYRKWLEEAALLRRFALPAILVHLSVQPFEWLSRMILARQDGGFDELGIFTAAMSLSQIVCFLPQQVTSAGAPVLANEMAAGNLASVRRIVKGSLLAALAAGILTALPLLCGSRWILGAYGPHFTTGSGALALLLMAYTLSAGTLALKTSLIASGLVWAQVRHSLVYGGVLVGAALLLAPYGATGMGLAYLAAYAVLLIVQSLAAWLRGLLGNPRGFLKNRTALSE